MSGRTVVLAAQVLSREIGFRLEGLFGAIELEGASAADAALALQQAQQPVPLAQLGDIGVPLLEAGALVEVVQATDRLRVVGAPELERALATLWVPASLRPLTVAMLGSLGSPTWRAAVGAAEGLTLAVSLEREATWVGPVFEPGLQGGACPRCLWLRRLAATPQVNVDPVAVPYRSWQGVAEAVVLLAQGRDRTSVHFIAGPATTHQLLPSPFCPTCAPPSVDVVARLAEPDAPEPGSALQSPFLDPVLGPLFNPVLEAVDGFRGLPLMVGGVRTVTWTPHGPLPKTVRNNVFGSGFTLQRRQRVQFSEGLERLALLSQRPDVLSTTSAALGALAIDPASVAGFAPWQYEDPGFGLARHQGQPLDWVRVHELISGTERLLPFDAVAVGREAPGRERRLIDEPFYTGGATHTSARRAVAHALLELVERDAFMLAWYLQLPLTELEVDLGDLGADTAEAVRYLEARGISMRFFDLAVDFAVPCVLALAQARATRGRWPAGGRVLSGCGATTSAGAVGRCVSEMLGQFTALCCVPFDEKAEPTEADQEQAWLPILERYLAGEVPEAFGFLRGTVRRRLDQRRDVPDGADALEWLLGQLRERSLEVCVRLLDAPDVRTTGLSVVKVVVPGLLRPARSRLEVNLGVPRVAAVAARHGVPPTISPHPHPVA